MNEWLLRLWHFSFLPTHFFNGSGQVYKTKKQKKVIDDSIRAKTLNAVNNFQFVSHTLPQRRRLLVDLFRFKTKCEIKCFICSMVLVLFYFWSEKKKGRFKYANRPRIQVNCCSSHAHFETVISCRIQRNVDISLIISSSPWTWEMLSYLEPWARLDQKWTGQK